MIDTLILLSHLQIRGVEIGIVLIVLMVWAGAIALFFNRWGKIRMLLPYQPDYKHEQLKVPGTGVCSASGCNGQHSHQVWLVHPMVVRWCAGRNWDWVCVLGELLWAEWEMGKMNGKCTSIKYLSN